MKIKPQNQFSTCDSLDINNISRNQPQITLIGPLSFNSVHQGSAEEANSQRKMIVSNGFLKKGKGQFTGLLRYLVSGRRGEEREREVEDKNKARCEPL